MILTETRTGLEIKIITVEEDRLTLSVKANTDFDPKVRSPKLSAVFDNGRQTRYLPLSVIAYYPNEDLKTCSILGQYTFLLSSLFLGPLNDEDIVKIRFDLIYGETFIDNIPITGVSWEEEDPHYNVVIDMDESIIKLSRKGKYAEPKRNIAVSVIKLLIMAVYEFIVMLFGILLLPWFFIDAVLAKLNMTKAFPQIESRQGLFYIIDHVRIRFKSVTKQEIGRRTSKKNLAKSAVFIFSKHKVKSNRITFLSNRCNDLSGNFEHVYELIKDNSDIEICTLLDSRPIQRMSASNVIRFAYLYCTSAVVVVDDYYELLSFVEKHDGVKLVQLWHACGAFKTFGFSRLGKPGGPSQTSVNHRYYDYAIVSSNNIRRFYAEGFGIPFENVVATGVPRTDIFFDETYKEKIKEAFYKKYPALRGKKIMLFAPTFRGNGKLSGDYPLEKFDLKTVYEKTGGEYAILIKLHPFIKQRFNIPEKYKDYILDFSDKPELNDLLFVTDLLISDYSSVIFEAALLDIPMLFYAYDLNEYVAQRDFYYEYESFLPGKCAENFSALIDAVNNHDFEVEKIEPFKHKFFDYLDGKSSQRVAQLLVGLLNSPQNKA